MRGEEGEPAEGGGVGGGEGEEAGVGGGGDGSEEGVEGAGEVGEGEVVLDGDDLLDAGEDGEYMRNERDEGTYLCRRRC